MKIGVRKPSLSKSLKARTTSKLKRQVKRAVIPTYGQKGTGLIKNPKRAIYNKIYNQTTVDALGSIKKENHRNKIKRLTHWLIKNPPCIFVVLSSGVACVLHLVVFRHKPNNWIYSFVFDYYFIYCKHQK